MQKIVKTKEPRNFTEQKAKGIQSFDDLDKTALRTSLIAEQGYLCCYCMSRIQDNGRKVRIEHWYPESESRRENDIRRTIDYSNLFLACNGECNKEEYCDVHKKHKKISINPRNEGHINQIKYRKDGFIYCDITNFNDDINKTLNLNANVLKQNRQIVYDLVREKLSSFVGTCSNNDIQKMINKWESRSETGKNKEYYMVAVYFLKNKLNK